ncbi:hypothetical protein LTR78_001506 [Recurvomyces mirabilis]|uniref:Uncharacterized protein n=1 Tax=Recurvomyces mirabilis TaxID=574656 RepID=A0AAE0WW59_9PEZI|nr:hypothetical protein LTR78_001506 [Recurvomyces mirabilis]KAK5161485.1 hypothetical protein LTS14_001281 [Recurvomyces mirabilis]
MPDHDHPPITFGIELELVAVWNDAQCEPWQALYYALLGANIPIIGGEAGRVADLTLAEHGKEYTHWRISQDCAVESVAEKATWPGGFGCESVELSSRKFYFGDREDWRGEVQRVLDVVAKIENAGCRFLLNKSAGFHVHVGQQGSSFSLRTAKNVLQFCTAFERLLDGIHATNRILYPSEFEFDHWHIPLSWFHQHNHTALPNTNLYDWLRAIEDMKTFAELKKFFLLDETFVEELDTYGARADWPMTHNSAVNIENLHSGHPEERIKGTVEFRQHAGTVDMLAIVHWVEVVVRIVDFCRTEDPANFVAFLALGIDSSFELGELLDAIDVEARTVQFYAPSTAGTDTTIGFLNHGGLARPDYTEDVDELMEVNEREQNMRLDRTSAFRNATIAEKNYGYGPHLIIRDQHRDVVEPAITRIYDQIDNSVEWKNVDDEVMIGEGEWWIRRCVWVRLSGVLRASEQGLLEEEEVRGAETGPVVWIGREGVLVRELEEMGLYGHESRYD